MGYVPPADVAERLQRQVQPALGQLTPAACVDLSWSWAAMQRRPQPGWWVSAERALPPQALSALPAAALARMLWAMARHGHVPPQEWLLPCLHALAARLQPAGPSAGAGSSAARPVGQHQQRARARPVGSSSSSAGAASGAPPHLHARDVADLAWALGSMVHEGGHNPAMLPATGALQVGRSTADWMSACDGMLHGAGLCAFWF